MKLIIFSDLQLKSYESYSKLTPDGINDRLMDHIHVLEQIKQYALTHGVKNILFLGDGFDSRGTISVVAANLFLEWKHQISELGIFQYDLVGNHDLVNKSHKLNSLDLFAKLPNVNVINEPKWVVNDDFAAYFVPYMHRSQDIRNALHNCEPPKKVKKKSAICLMHYGLFDTEINGRIIAEDEGLDTEGQVRLSDLNPILQYVNNVFLGHFHTHASYNGNVHYVGTPLQHNWGEASLPGRFIVIDTETGEFQPVYTKAPRFIEFDNPNISESLIEGNFCRVTVNSFDEKEEKVKYFKEKGARAFEVLVQAKSKNIASKTNLNLGMSFLEMGKKLLDVDKIGDYNREKLEIILNNALDYAVNKTI